MTSLNREIKSRQKTISKFFFVNSSLMLEYVYTSLKLLAFKRKKEREREWTEHITDDFHVSKVISDLIFERSGGFYERWCVCFAVSSFPVIWKRVKPCFALTERIRISIIRLNFITSGTKKGQQSWSWNWNRLCSLEILADFHSKLLLCRLWGSRGISLGILFPTLVYCSFTFFK